MSNSKEIETKWDAPVNEMVSIDPKTSSAKDLYKLIIGAIVPRPIAFVSTHDGEGKLNVAPYSFFNGVASNPPTIMFSVGVPSPENPEKDTLKNIKKTGDFVVNSANQWMIESVVHCASAFPYGVSEFEKVGLTPLKSEIVGAYRVKESAIHMECKTLKIVQIGNGAPGSSHVIFGEIVKAHVMKEAIHEGRIDPKVIQNVGRMGGFSYTTLGEVFDIPVPPVED
jgi:flavin reductase (DIM6/NTAB) family NADH-FMN oxidoreductase RutF